MNTKVLNLLSIIFHPLFVAWYVSVILLHACPYQSNFVPSKQMFLYDVQNFCNMVLYPGFTVFLLWRIGFLKNMYMRNAQERLGPLIACILFFFWNYYVFYKLTELPAVFKVFLLGVFISTSLLFISTIFTKMSMHATAIGGAVVALLLSYKYYTCNMLAYVICAIAIGAVVCYARLALKEHTRAEVFTGLAIGVISQLIAWLYLSKLF